MRNITLLYLVVVCVFGWLSPLVCGEFPVHHSAIFFGALYMLGRYFGKYRILEQWSRRRWLLCFIAAVTINASVFTVLQLCFPTGALHQYLTDLFGKYSNMFTMSGSLALVLCFAGIHFRSAVVNRLSMSAFSLFVIHVNPYMTLRFSEFLSGILDRCPHCRVPVMIAVIVAFYIFWAIIDQLRIWLWQALTTRHRQK